MSWECPGDVSNQTPREVPWTSDWDVRGGCFRTSPECHIGMSLGWPDRIFRGCLGDVGVDVLGTCSESVFASWEIYSQNDLAPSSSAHTHYQNFWTILCNLIWVSLLSPKILLKIRPWLSWWVLTSKQWLINSVWIQLLGWINLKSRARVLNLWLISHGEVILSRYIWIWKWKKFADIAVQFLGGNKWQRPKILFNFIKDIFKTLWNT